MTPGTIALLLLAFTMPFGMMVYWIVVGIRRIKRRKQSRLLAKMRNVK